MRISDYGPKSASGSIRGALGGGPPENEGSTKKLNTFAYLIVNVDSDCAHNGTLTKGVCSELCDLVKFGEICDNISLTVQDRDTVNFSGRLIGNRMWPIEWRHCQCP